MTFLVKSGSVTVVARTATDAQKLARQLGRDGGVSVTDFAHREVDLRVILLAEAAAKK
jgi:glutamyl-tRNA reductase